MTERNLYEVAGDIKDINTLLVSREAWNRRAQPAQAVPVLTDAEIDAAEIAGGNSYRRWTMSGPRGQMLLPGDSLQWHIARAVEQAVRAKMGVGWIAVADHVPPPDTWLLVAWGDGAVDKAHTFSKWKHPTNPLGYLIQGHPGPHNDVTHWMLLPPPPGIVGKEGT